MELVTKYYNLSLFSSKDWTLMRHAPPPLLIFPLFFRNRNESYVCVCVCAHTCMCVNIIYLKLRASANEFVRLGKNNQEEERKFYNDMQSLNTHKSTKNS